MTNFIWKINQMCTVNVPETGFVTTVMWVLVGEDGEYTAQNPGISRFYKQEDNFTPYDQLTEQQVIGWVQDSMSQAEMESMYYNLDAQIQSQKNPSIYPQPQPLPW